MNNINASIVDQRVTGIVEEQVAWLPEGRDENKKRSAAFVLLCMSCCLDLPLADVAELLTEGGQDAGVDGLHIGEVEDGEFLVTLFQGKYKVKDLSGNANFPENGVQKAVNIVQVLFDPARDVALNPKIRPKVEEIRSLVRDGYIPDVRIVLCNNGAEWKAEAQHWIDQSGLPAQQTNWLHFNHDSIVDVLKKTRSVDASLNFAGEAIVEDFNFRRVLVGKVSVAEIAELFNQHGGLLLQRNIRRYLGLHTNRVNTAIHDTLADKESRGDFYFFNNGITVICKQFRHNALQQNNYQVRLENMQVINGGQTCKTIQQTLQQSDSLSAYSDVYVMVRVYELAEDDQGFVSDITYATNSQNPVDLRDLRSNDERQKQMELGIKDLGYVYKRQREEGGSGSKIVTSAGLAEAVLAIWRRSPHQAKFQRREHFGRLYDVIFANLNAAQALLAVFIFRYVENERRHLSDNAKAPAFLPYASHYLAMVTGQKLLESQQLTVERISHRNFDMLRDRFMESQATLYAEATVEVENALKVLYGSRKISLQQLAATFRRGDLLEILWIDEFLQDELAAKAE